jgi:hypothetical protein
MLALVVSLQVKPGHRDAFLAAITEQAKRSSAEHVVPGSQVNTITEQLLHHRSEEGVRT